MRTYAYDSYGKVTEIKDYRNLLSDGDKAVKKTYTYGVVYKKLTVYSQGFHNKTKRIRRYSKWHVNMTMNTKYRQ